MNITSQMLEQEAARLRGLAGAADDAGADIETVIGLYADAADLEFAAEALARDEARHA